MSNILIFSSLISALYALVALGFTMIFGVARVLNLAHGAFVMVAAYVVYFIEFETSLNIYLSALLAVLITALLAMALYRWLIRHIQKSQVATMIVTLALALILEQLVTIYFGSTPQILSPFVSGSTLLWGVRVVNNRILAFALSWIIILAFGFFVRKSKTGKAISACSMDQVGASLVGINTELIYTLTWGISGALAGVAGIFLASSLTMVPSMWRDPLIIAFAIVILGGLGSVRGSLIAAYLIGFVETLTTYTPQLGPEFRGLPSLIILMIILAFRPKGIFGR